MNSILYLKYRPPQSNLAIIIWENLLNRNWTLTKKIIANIFIFIVAFFITTPQFVVHQLDPILNALKNLTARHAPNNITANQSDASSNSPEILEHIRYLPIWLTDFLPTLMIWTFTALLPVVVAYADLLVGYWTKSGQNHIIMVIILPTFGFTSSHVYIDFLLRNIYLSSS